VRELGACRAKSERFFVPRQNDFSVLCALLVETVLWRSGVSFAAKWRMKSVCLFRGKMENEKRLSLSRQNGE
jgi:hypothetical protein